jgi:hypothetical protein
LEAELHKNLGDLEKLGQLLMQSKGQTFYLPAKNMLQLLKTFSVMRDLRVNWRKKKMVVSVKTTVVV